MSRLRRLVILIMFALSTWVVVENSQALAEPPDVADKRSAPAGLCHNAMAGILSRQGRARSSCPAS